MGADMVGAFLYVPVKISGKVLKKHLNAVEKCLAPNSIKFILDLKSKKKSAPTTADVFADLKKIGVSIGDYGNDLGIDDEEADEDQRKEFLEAIQADLDFLKKDIDFDFRDLAYDHLVVNGCHVDVYFAGEMSWGDEPEGSGYQLIKTMLRFGVAQAFFKAIPWDKRLTSHSSSSKKSK